MLRFVPGVLTQAVSRSEREGPVGEVYCHGLPAMVGASTGRQCSCPGARMRSRHWSRPSMLCYLSVLLCISTSCLWSANAFALHSGTRLTARIRRIPYAYRNVRSFAAGKDARNEGANKQGPLIGRKVDSGSRKGPEVKGSERESENDEVVDVVASLSPPYLPVDGSGVEEVMAVLQLEEDEETARQRQRDRANKAKGLTGGDGSQGPPMELSVRGTMDWFGGLNDDQKRNVFKILLACVAVLYGTNFGAIKYLDEANVDVSIITAGRFLLAAIALFPFLWRQNKELFVKGFEVGLWVSVGYICQAIGLETTKASNSAFICSLSVVVVPVINGLLYKRRIPATTWAACLMAITGVGLLTLQGAGGPVIGDLWSLGQPVGFGLAFVKTERYMTRHKDKALAMTAAQMTAVAICSLLWTGLAVTTRNPDLSVLMDPVHLGAMAYTGLVTSAFAVVVESVALSYVPVEETTVILSTEPVWAALFGAVVLNEKLNGWGYVGAGIIIAGCLLTQLQVNGHKDPTENE